MQSTYVVTGVLTDQHTVTLDKALPLTSMKVRVTVEPLMLSLYRSYEQVMANIRRRQRVRGHQSPSREVVDTYVRAERASWEA